MIEGVVYTLLEPLVEGRCFADDFLQYGDLPRWPAIRYQITSRINEEAVCGTDDVSTDDVSVQVDFVAKTKGAAIALRDEGIAALMTHNPPPARGNGFSAYDRETKTYREVSEFMFQQSSVAV